MLGIDMQHAERRIFGVDVVGRLHQPLRARKSLLQGDSAGAARRPAQSRAAGRLLHAHRHGELIPLSTLVKLEESVQPQQLKRFQQLNSVTITGVPRPGVTLGEALKMLDRPRRRVLPQGYSVDYAGQSRQFKTEGAAALLALFFALIVIYLVLAAQFESFRDPIIMLVTVPMSICGAMLFVSLGLTTLNIYTQVGLVTLIGVISKHGILIVEFANRLREQGARSARRSRRPPRSACARC